MAYKITDSCVSCGLCKENCPADAISEGDGIFVINADTCVGCGLCKENCPVDAPVEE